MVKVVGVRFRTEGKIYFFDPLQFEIKRGDNLIVETARGIEFGTAVSGIREVAEESVVQPLKPILRIANRKDLEQEKENKEKEKEAYKICQEKIRKHGLDMKLIDAEYTFDNNKLLFHFTADGRVDFRELVKDLAAIFKTRIELRQIGVRDETRFLGGIGICGRPLCCSTYLSDLIKTVSIKMAKEQNLSLNPTKISGVCGRLMCCLKNEEETYEELNRRLPNIGDTVVTPDGQRGEVHSVNVLRQLVKVLVEAGDDKELKEFEVDRLKFHRRHGKKDKQDLSPEEIKELEKLEQEEEEDMEAALAEAGKAGKQENKENNEHRGRNSQGRDRGPREDRGDRQRRDRDFGGKNERRGQERAEKNERQGRGDHQNQERGERGDRSGRERGERQNQERGERGQRQNQEKRDRQDRQDRQNRQDRSQRGSGQERGEGKRERRDRQDKPRSDKNRFGNRDRQDRNPKQQSGGEDQ